MARRMGRQKNVLTSFFAATPQAAFKAVEKRDHAVL